MTTADDAEATDLDAPDAEGDEGWDRLDIPDDPDYREQADDFDREFARFRERVEDSEDLEVEGDVFDVPTLKALYKLVHDGHVEAIGAPISTGKEALVLEADGPEGVIALKIYRTQASSFDDMRYYLRGDPRFEGIGDDKRAVVAAWVRKEFSNLERARAADVRVPQPIAAERNVLAMEFVGHGTDRAPQLREVDLENPETAYEVVATYMERLESAGLVHGDLSEYNVLVHDGEIVVIDVGQAVTHHHPNSDALLATDCENVTDFFRRQGLDVRADELLDRVRDEVED